MRNGIVLLGILLITSPGVFAQSTCQTRVDAHQNATTPQRVEYCLTQEADPSLMMAQPELIYAQVSSHQPAKEPKQKEYSSANPYFNENKYTVMHGYVGTTQFPEFQNATISEQELAARRKVWLEHEAALNRAAAQPVYVPTAQPVLTKPAVTKPAVLVTETRAGLARRSTKPNRVMKQTVAVEKTIVSSTPQSVEKDTETTLEETPKPVQSQTVEQKTNPPDADELGLTLDNPYAQPTDLTDADEMIPYGEK